VVFEVVTAAAEEGAADLEISSRLAKFEGVVVW